MSKHRNRSKSAPPQAQGGGNPFMNPQMLQMLGVNESDMQKLSGVMNSMGNEGFDMNSLSSMFGGNGQGPKSGTAQPQPDLGNMAGLLNMFGGGQGGGNGMPDMGGMAGLMSMLGGGGGLGGLGGLGGNNNGGQLDMNSLMSMLGGLGGNNMGNNNGQNSSMNNMVNNNGQNFNMNNNINPNANNINQGNVQNQQSTPNTNNNSNNSNVNQNASKTNKGNNTSNPLSMENLAAMLSSFPINDTKPEANISKNNIVENDKEIDNDPNVVMLNSIKKFVNTERGRFLDKVIDMYKNGEINY